MLFLDLTTVTGGNIIDLCDRFHAHVLASGINITKPGYKEGRARVCMHRDVSFEDVEEIFGVLEEFAKGVGQ